jgi:hypothetical protein
MNSKSNNPFTCDLVVSYYKENLDWLNNKTDKIDTIYIYSKGNKSPSTSIPHVEISIENIGRCDHTYLYHIITNYDKLADVTIFTTGSTGALKHKLKNFRLILANVFKTHNSCFLGQHENDVAKTQYDFKIDNYRSSNISNQEASAADILALASPRPFGRWYNKHFPGIKISHVVYYGVFAVSKKHIHAHPKSYYKKLIKEFPKDHSNPEVGHYFERSWVAVFHPLPPEVLYTEQSILLLTKSKTHKATTKRKTRKVNHIH